MSTMELEARKASFIRQVLDIDNDETFGRLEQYLRKVMHKGKETSLIAPMMSVTQEEFDSYIQNAVDDEDIATDDEVSQFPVPADL